MEQFRGKSGGMQETGCSAGPWLGPSLCCSKPWRSRKVGDQTREQGWTPEPQGRTLSFGAEESRMEKLGWRRAEP